MHYDAGLVSACLSGSDPISLSCFMNALGDAPHGAVLGLQGGDVFAASPPMLPIEDSLELLHVASDFDGQGNVGVVYTHGGHLFAVGFGLDKGAGLPRAFVS